MNFASQIEDRNFLSPTGFSFQIARSPKIGYFGTQINVPGLNLGAAIQPTYLKDLPRPGDKMDFGDLTLTFLVDANLENYMEIQNWMRGIGYPESLSEIYEWQRDKQDPLDYPSGSGDSPNLNLFADGTLNILSSNNNPVFKVIFKDLWPTALSALQFDAQITDEQYLTSTVTFKYSIYNITEIGCC
jgi:hypothetical protein